MADLLTQNGLSIGPLNPPALGLAPVSYAPGPSPAETVRIRSQTINTVQQLQFPSDLPTFYTGMSVSTYARKDLVSLGEGSTIFTMALPLPDRMMDMNNVAYNKVDFSAMIGNVINAGMDAFNKTNASGGDGEGELLKSVTDTAKNALTANNAKNIGTGAGIDALSSVPAALNAVKAATGKAPNYFLTVLLDGPRYKSFQLNWTFAPRSPAEAATLTRVLRIMKNAQAPGLGNGGATFTFPRIFRVWFAPDRAHLYQFKPCILESFEVDYSGGGLPAMKQARTETGGMHAPAIVKASATFTELEFWLRSDFGSDIDPNDPDANQLVGTAGPSRFGP